MKPTANEIQSILMARIFQEGEGACGNAIGVEKSEISRKMSGERGFKLTQICQLLEYLGASVVFESDGNQIVTTEELNSLSYLAQKGLGGVIDASDDEMVTAIAVIAHKRLERKTGGRNQGVVYSRGDE